MDFLKQNKAAIGTGVLLLIAAFVYLTYFSGGGSTPALSSSDQSQAISQDLLVTLQNLHTIKLDNSIFANPVFVSLTDFGVTIPPENIGRPDPFAPLAGFVAPSSGLQLPGTAK